MSDSRRAAVLRALVAVCALGCAQRAFATQKFGPLQLSGNLQSQNLVRMENRDTFQFVQNRNTARIRLDYDWLEGGKFYSKYDIPFIEKSHLFVLWRGVYDSIYTTTPGFYDKSDIHQNVYPASQPGKLTNVFNYATQVKGFSRNRLGLPGLGNDGLDALEFDNQLREAYTDVKFRGLPLSVRLGRQQIVWGETDNFRMLDRANALDLTWHFQQEIPAPAFGWDEIRRPYWMAKFLYDLGDIWGLSQNYLEWYWNPGDWRPAKQTFLPRPWGLPFYNPLDNPFDGAFIGGLCGTSSIKVPRGPNKGLGQCTQLLNNTLLFEKGDWARNPMENSQVGVRYHGIMPFGLEYTLNYFYQRFAGDDGTNYAPLRGLPLNQANTNRASKLVSRGIFPAEYFAPYVHTVGLSANYSDETFTQTVFRMETIYDVGIPFFDVAKPTVVDNPSLPGISKKNMWKGMIAFDRPTWIRTLNKKSTIFLTGQFFWHYLINNPGCEAQKIANLPVPDRPKFKSCLVGGLDLPSSVRTSPLAFRDKIRDWETLATLAAFTFYRGGWIVPVVGMAVDPTNQFNMEAFWTIDYVIRDDLVFNLAQRYFITPRGHSDPIFETWGLGGLNNGRSETSLRLTFQF